MNIQDTRPEYDVWLCFTNGRTTYKATEATGPVENALQPLNASKHLDRVQASSKRVAVREVCRRHWSSYGAQR